MQYHIFSINELFNQLYCVTLQPIGNGLQFLAGQYVELCFADGFSLPFSIANAPCEDNHIELIIRKQDDQQNQSLIKHITMQQYIDVRGPFGKCIYQNQKLNPILLVAGGTGIAQIKSILEAAINAEDQRKWNLYWSIKNNKEVELIDINKWQRALVHFQYKIVLQEMIHELVMQDLPDLSAFQCYLSGPWSLIDETLMHLKQHGIKQENLHSDRFEFL